MYGGRIVLVKRCKFPSASALRSLMRGAEIFFSDHFNIGGVSFPAVAVATARNGTHRLGRVKPVNGL